MAIIALKNSTEYALVDDEDLKKVSLCKWRFFNGYAVASVMGKISYLQRYVLMLSDRKYHVLFKNKIQTDCQKSNLILCEWVTSEYFHWGKETAHNGIRRVGHQFVVLVGGGKNCLMIGKYDDYETAIEKYNEANYAYRG